MESELLLVFSSSMILYPYNIGLPVIASPVGITNFFLWLWKGLIKSDLQNIQYNVSKFAEPIDWTRHNPNVNTDKGFVAPYDR